MRWICTAHWAVDSTIRQSESAPGTGIVFFDLRDELEMLLNRLFHDVAGVKISLGLCQCSLELTFA